MQHTHIMFIYVYNISCRLWWQTRWLYNCVPNIILIVLYYSDQYCLFSWSLLSCLFFFLIIMTNGHDYYHTTVPWYYHSNGLLAWIRLDGNNMYKTIGADWKIECGFENPWWRFFWQLLPSNGRILSPEGQNHGNLESRHVWGEIKQNMLQFIARTVWRWSVFDHFSPRTIKH